MIDRVLEINSKEIAISQDLTLSHAGTVWDGALTMAYYWNKNLEIANDFLLNKRVLELGSGTGIVGICAAAFNTKRVYLTDLPEYLKILEINQQKNNHLSGNG
jgi:predicted nicotinamide N-methyase